MGAGRCLISLIIFFWSTQVFFEHQYLVPPKLVWVSGVSEAAKPIWTKWLSQKWPAKQLHDFLVDQPYFEHVGLRFSYPDAWVIDVVPTSAVARVGRDRWVSQDGQVILVSDYPVEGLLDLPWMKLEQHDYAHYLDQLAKAKQFFVQWGYQVKGLIADDQQGLQVWAGEDIQLTMGFDNLDKKWQRMQVLFKHLAKKYPKGLKGLKVDARHVKGLAYRFTKNSKK